MAKEKKNTPLNTATLVGMLLTLLYTICVPAFDLRYKLSSIIGHSFLDAQSNTTTFDNYLYYLAYIPLLIFALIWAYGICKWLAENRGWKSKYGFIGIYGCILFYSFAAYFMADFVFSLMYRLNP
jgi:hypothetical protein